MTPSEIFHNTLNELKLEIDDTHEIYDTPEFTITYIGQYYDEIETWRDRILQWIKDTQENYPGYLKVKMSKYVILNTNSATVELILYMAKSQSEVRTYVIQHCMKDLRLLAVKAFDDKTLQVVEITKEIEIT